MIYDQYCSCKEYVTNFEIGLEFAEIIAGFSLEVSFSIFLYIYVSSDAVTIILITIFTCRCAANCCA